MELTVAFLNGLDPASHGCYLPRMTTRGKVAVAVAALLGAIVAGAIIRPGGASAGSSWACASDHIANDVSTLAVGGGYKTTDEALLAEARSLAADKVADGQALTDAAVTDVGRSSGRLIIGGQIFAEVAFAKLQDGTWTVGSTRYCSPPPVDGGSPGPTPVGTKASA